MKHLSVLLASLLLSTAVQATEKKPPHQPNVSSNSSSHSGAAAGAIAGSSSESAALSGSTSNATNAGNVQSQSLTITTPSQTNSNVNSTINGTQRVVSEGTTTSNVNYGGEVTVKNVPGIGAPNLTSSNDTCMGSVSAAGSGVGFGVAFGTTWTDKNCVMLKNSREMWNMGMRSAALARMCMDDLNREALEITGYQCPDRKGSQPQALPTVSVVSGQ